MKSHEIENWALSIVDRVEAGQPVEDSRVELKATWLEAAKAARRIAGHANAARGEPILWLIGVDEKNGVVAVEHQEFANWWAEVKACFDGLAPDVTDLNVLAGGHTIVALLFQTDRAPFVVKNPAYGNRGGGAVSLEVPWREGTSVRSATRADLLRLLSPLQALPTFEMLSGSLVAKLEEVKSQLYWSLAIDLYADSTSDETIVIPYHRCGAAFRIAGKWEWTSLEDLALAPPVRISLFGVSQAVVSASRTIDASPDQVAISGPGRIDLTAATRTSDVDLGPSGDAEVRVTLVPTNGEYPVTLHVQLARLPMEGVSWPDGKRTLPPGGSHPADDGIEIYRWAVGGNAEE